MPFDEPGCVVALPKDEQRLTEVLDGVEGLHPQEVLLERADEALGAAISLGGSHEGGRTLDAQEGKLSLEGVGHVLAPMIVPDRETAPDRPTPRSLHTRGMPQLHHQLRLRVRLSRNCSSCLDAR